MNARYGFKFSLFSIALFALVVSGCAKTAQTDSPPSGSAGQSGTAGKPGSGSGSPASGGVRRSAVVPVQAKTVEIGVLTADQTTAGVVTPVTQSQVVAQVAGVVRSVPRRVGDWVKAGDIVMQLDDSQLKLTLASATATLENAKINLAMGKDTSSDANPKLAYQLQSAQAAYDSAKKYYDAQKALYDLGGISASQLDTANSQLATAQANLEGAKTSLSQNGKADDQTIAQLKLSVTSAQNQVDQARLNLQNAIIRAPFAGQIAALNLQPGMYASLNTSAFTLVSAERQISFNVSPSDAALLKLGSSITFLFQGTKYPSRVSQSPSAPISGVVPMFASSGAASLSYGSVGTVMYRVPLAQGALVPLSSLETLEDQNYVFVIENNKVSTKNVTIIAEAGTTAAVNGVDSGDVVIVSPPPGLIKGAQVQPTMVKGSGTLSVGTDKAPSGQTGKPDADIKAAEGSGTAPGTGAAQGTWTHKSGSGASAKSAQAGSQ